MDEKRSSSPDAELDIVKQEIEIVHELEHIIKELK